MTDDHDAWLLDPKAHDAWYALRKCADCGEEITDEDEGCPDCGKEREDEEEK
tara:strand:- start:196 stop:351 length:156 start_codon:yes stop_codon:yes gene_type:complete